ncbi:hypothetical protein PQR53_37100 [Paraburkholderia fungorum]|uniref:hypothetical protein n=1 Tax=Paraburkholderia fungorum TaxID=134537 RepID=UPI0038BDCE98
MSVESLASAARKLKIDPSQLWNKFREHSRRIVALTKKNRKFNLENQRKTRRGRLVAAVEREMHKQMRAGIQPTAGHVLHLMIERKLASDSGFYRRTIKAAVSKIASGENLA